MKKLITILLSLCLLLVGCNLAIPTHAEQYTANYLTLFDTVTTIVGRANTQAEFEKTAKQIHDALLQYHQLFDIYNTYENIPNLKTINDNAGIQPVTVDKRIIALLLDCKEYYRITDGNINVAMGSLLKIWHKARTDGINAPDRAKLPDEEELQAAALHMNLDCVEINQEASTVYIKDPKVQLDVGAIAKGWAVQAVAENAPKGLLISIGGNVFATGPKTSDGTAWVVGIQNPDGGDSYLHTIHLTQGAVVTSGDYQRAYVVDNRLYHHIIDPQTLYPSRYWRSVSIVCPDSGLADVLSTALFLLPLTEGKALLAQFDAAAMWVDTNGKLYYSPGFETLIRS